MHEFSHLIDLASARLGAAAVAANDEFFAAKDNLVNPEPPVFIPDKYTDCGKWMDGWETRRRRTPGHDCPRRVRRRLERSIFRRAAQYADALSRGEYGGWMGDEAAPHTRARLGRDPPGHPRRREPGRGRYGTLQRQLSRQRVDRYRD